MNKLVPRISIYLVTPAVLLFDIVFLWGFLYINVLSLCAAFIVVASRLFFRVV